MLIDTQGARSVLLEMAVLASGLALSPVTPEILAARELRRGTMQLLEDIAPYRHLGIEPPPLDLLINRVHPVSANARMIQQALRDLFQDHAGIRVLGTDVPAIEAYPRAATRGLPVHRVEYRQPPGRVAPAALDTMRARLLVFPQWQDRFALVSGRPPRSLKPGGPMANAHELARGHKRLRALIEFAVSEGWHVKRTGWTPQIHQDRLRRHLHTARPRAITEQTSTPVRRFAEPSARPAWPGPPTPRDAAMAE